MKFKFHALAGAAAVCSLLGQAAFAQDTPEFKFSGFGTLGGVVTNNDDAQFRSSIRQDKGADKSVDFGVDSRLGLQLSTKLNSTFSGVAQVILSRVDGKEQPRVEWLYGQAAVTPWLDLRVGRMVMPAFMVSDSLNVGYSSHWLRAPIEAYALYFPTAFDGAQAQMRTTVAGTNLTLQVSAGKSDVTVYAFGQELEGKLPKLKAVNLLAENGNWLFRLGQVQSKNSELTNANLKLNDLNDIFTGAGVQYDDGSLLVMAEYLSRKFEGQPYDGAFDSNSSYITAGYRFGPWMPYATFSQSKPKTTLINKKITAETSAVGLRWDAYKNVAIKAQFEKTSPGFNFIAPTVGPFTADPRAFPKVNVFSMVADFVF